MRLSPDSLAELGSMSSSPDYFRKELSITTPLIHGCHITGLSSPMNLWESSGRPSRAGARRHYARVTTRKRTKRMDALFSGPPLAVSLSRPSTQPVQQASLPGSS